jgi:WD40 repeat protein
MPFFSAALLLPGNTPPAEAPKKPLLDAYGDPLPRGATARFGSSRWRMPDAIRALAVSQDGKLAGSVNMDGRVAVWDMDTGKKVHEFAGSGSGEGCLAFAPDGRHLATGGRFDNLTGAGDFRVRIWDLSTGKQRARFPEQGGTITSVAFSPDGTAAVSSGFCQPVTVWGFPGGNKLREFPTITDEYGHFVLSPNGRRIAVTGDLNTVVVYDFVRGTRLRQFRTGKYHYNHFQFSHDNRLLMTLEPSRLCLWEIETGKARLEIPLEHDLCRRAYLSPDGKKIGVIDLGHDIQWLSATTGRPLDRWKGCLERVEVLAFTREGDKVLSSDWGAIRVWDAASGKVLQEASGPRRGCYSLVFDASGRTPVAGSEDLHILDGRTLRERHRLPITMDWQGGPKWRHSVGVSPDGSFAAAVGSKGEIVLVDTAAGKVLRTLGPPQVVARSVAFGPDSGRLFVAGEPDAGLRTFDVRTGEEGPRLCKDLIPKSNLVGCQAGKLAVVAGGEHPRCRIWDARSGKEEPSVEDYPWKLLWSPDGKYLAGYYPTSHVNVWDVTRRVLRRRLDIRPGDGVAWSFSADGQYMIVSRDGGSFVTWSLASGKKVAEVKGHGGGVVALACPPDGVSLVSGGTDCAVLRWDATAWQGE